MTAAALLVCGMVGYVALMTTRGLIHQTGQSRFVPIYCWWVALALSMAGVVVRLTRRDARGSGLWLTFLASVLLSAWGLFGFAMAHTRF